MLNARVSGGHAFIKVKKRRKTGSMKIRYAIPALVAAAALALSGCTSNTEGEEYVPYDISGVSADDAVVALLPADIADRGTIKIGINPEYPPNEYKNSKGEISGWAVDLAGALAAKMGLEIEWEDAGFDTIIPKITGGTMDMGSSSFTDNPERQKSVDFVNYYEAGVLWAAPLGAEVEPDDACGLKVAVQATTFQHTDELPEKSEACEAAGKDPIEILPYETQSEATNAVVQGKAAAFTADSPVTLFAINQLSDKIGPSGMTFDVAPYGYPLDKDSELTPAVQAALQSLMDDGTYLAILEYAGVADGAITTATINAGG
ncbi:MAG TPA: ABC transporter substrate-binding protein [Microbacteriaceae bacterium]|nr:ABC transporter substrate-binding protein [Microbacteriaceae bacterium]